MSQPCSVAGCGRSSRALCHCCRQNLCREHLIQHDDLLNSQLTPLADEINKVYDRQNNMNVRNLLLDTSEKLEQWRQQSYRLIDEYVNEKLRFIEENTHSKFINISDRINELKTLIGQLIKRQDTTIDDLNTITSNIHNVQRDLTQLQYKSNDLCIKPLVINNDTIELDDEDMKEDFNLSNLTISNHTINRSPESPKPLASNNTVLLMHQNDQLCLLDRDLNIIRAMPWNYNWIWDMCWSSTLSRFFIITLNDIYLLDSHTMNLECIFPKSKYALSACTCSDKSLFVSTSVLSSIVYEFSLLPTIALVKQSEPGRVCKTDESIQDIIFHKGTLGLIIANHTSQTKRMELLFSETFEQIWSVQFDFVDPLHNLFRLCLLHCHDWLVIDWRTSNIFHVTKNGQLKSTYGYDQIPYRCCQFGSNMLAISTKNSVNFHKNIKM